MKKLIPVLVVLLVLVAGGCAPQVDVEAEKAAIQRTYEEWKEAVEAKDIDRWASFWTEDAIWLVPNGPTLTGKEALRDFYAQWFADADFVLSSQQTEVKVAGTGEWAFARGTAEVTLQDPEGKRVTTYRQWVKLWEKHPDGSWKCSLNIGHIEPAATDQ